MLLEYHSTVQEAAAASFHLGVCLSLRTRAVAVLVRSAATSAAASASCAAASAPGLGSGGGALTHRLSMLTTSADKELLKALQRGTAPVAVRALRALAIHRISVALIADAVPRVASVFKLQRGLLRLAPALALFAPTPHEEVNVTRDSSQQSTRKVAAGGGGGGGGGGGVVRSEPPADALWRYAPRGDVEELFTAVVNALSEALGPPTTRGIL